MSFQGGVAANAGMVRAFTEILDLKDGELIIPEYYASMGAIGAVLYSQDQISKDNGEFQGIKPLEDYLSNYEKAGQFAEYTISIMLVLLVMQSRN